MTLLKRAITAPFLDELLSRLDTHFSKTQQLAVKALSIVPSVLLQASESHSQNSLVDELTKFYEGDIPSSSCLSQELEVQMAKVLW